MEGEFAFTDLVVSCIVIEIVEIIDIVYNDFVLFTLLEVILDIEALDPGWV